MDRAVAQLSLLFLSACGGTEERAPPETFGSPYAVEVVSYLPGPGAGFGQTELPGVVLGPPKLQGASPSLDVLSLGAGGEIVLAFDAAITDGPGPDFVVFENPFWVMGDPTDPYAELGEIAVSADGVTWSAFACDHEGDGAGHFAGCAGWSPTAGFDAETPLDPAQCGGDAFDLSDLGVSEARFVRILDLDGGGDSPSVGFDLDAVGLVHYRTIE